MEKADLGHNLKAEEGRQIPYKQNSHNSYKTSSTPCTVITDYLLYYLAYLLPIQRTHCLHLLTKSCIILCAMQTTNVEKQIKGSTFYILHDQNCVDIQTVSSYVIVKHLISNDGQRVLLE